MEVPFPVAWGTACNLSWMTLSSSFLPFKGSDTARFLGKALWAWALCYQGTQRHLWKLSPEPCGQSLPLLAGARSMGSLAVCWERHTCFLFSEPPFRQEEKLVCDSCVTPCKALSCPGALFPSIMRKLGSSVPSGF